jgi:hypothetical protein
VVSINDVELEKAIGYLRAYSDRIEGALRAAGIDLNARADGVKVQTKEGESLYFTTEELRFFSERGFDLPALAKSFDARDVAAFEKARSAVVQFRESKGLPATGKKRELTEAQAAFGRKQGISRTDLEKCLNR